MYVFVCVLNCLRVRNANPHCKTNGAVICITPEHVEPGVFNQRDMLGSTGCFHASKLLPTKLTSKHVDPPLPAEGCGAHPHCRAPAVLPGKLYMLRSSASTAPTLPAHAIVQLLQLLLASKLPLDIPDPFSVSAFMHFHAFADTMTTLARACMWRHAKLNVALSKTCVCWSVVLASQSVCHEFQRLFTQS